jgi:GAF domain-containing protein
MAESDEAARWRTYYQALYRVASALGQSLETESVLRELVRGVVEALGLRAASIRLLRPAGTLETVAVEGLSAEYLQKGTVDLAHSLIDREVIEHRQAIQIPDVSQDPRFEYPEAARREGIVSAVFVPLIARDTPIGVLRAYSGATYVFSQEEVELLTALANLGALAIANAQLYQICVREQQMTAEALWNFRLPDEWLRGP